MDNIVMLAGAAVLAAFVVPQLMPSDPKAREEPNIVRQKERPAYMKRASVRSSPSKKSRRSQTGGCERHRDLGSDKCSSISYSAPRKRKKIVAPKKSTGGRSVTVDPDSSGHFQTMARMNGRRVPVLVDTGASSVAINISLARKLGINVRDKDFIHTANTANGTVKIAKAKISNIRIGGIVLDGVDAFVMPDNALSKTLLGMSFLNRLTKYQVEYGKLKLTQ